MADVDTFEMLMNEASLTIEWPLAMTILPDIGYSGSVEFFTKFIQHFPECNQHLDKLIGKILRWDRLGLFSVVFERWLQGIKLRKQISCIEDTFVASCSRGAMKITKLLWDKCPISIVPRIMNASLLGALTFGNLSTLRYFLLDEPRDCRHVLLPPEFREMLLAAVTNDQVEIMRFLLFDLPPCLDAETVQYYSALFAEAAALGRFDIMDLLLGPDRYGQLLAPQLDTPEAIRNTLQHIGRSGRVDSLEHLLGWSAGHHGSRPRLLELYAVIAENTLLCNACALGHLNMVKFLLCKDSVSGQYLIPGINPAAYRHRPLIQACRNGHTEVVKELLHRDEQNNPIHAKVNPAFDNNQPLFEAVCEGRLQIVEFLLDGAPGPNRRIQYAFPGVHAGRVGLLHAAVEGRHLQVATFLLRCNEDNVFVHYNIDIPVNIITLAMAKGDPEFLHMLLTLPLVHRDEMLNHSLARAVRDMNPRDTKWILTVLHGPDADLDQEAVPEEYINYLIEGDYIPFAFLNVRKLESWQLRFLLLFLKKTLTSYPAIAISLGATIVFAVCEILIMTKMVVSIFLFMAVIVVSLSLGVF